MNRKGQALVEFIIILPVLLLIIISMIDIGNIFDKKYDLENDIQTVENLYTNSPDKLSSYLTKQNISFKAETSDDMTTLIISKEVKINTPVLEKVLGKNYKIESKKTILNE